MSTVLAPVKNTELGSTQTTVNIDERELTYNWLGSFFNFIVIIILSCDIASSMQNRFLS